jgi:hypothetical protein
LLGAVQAWLATDIDPAVPPESLDR